MHEDRQQNAFTALDILARADSMAFAHARSDAGRIAAYSSGRTAESGMRARRSNPMEDPRSLAELQAERQRLENEGQRQANSRGAWPPAIIKKIDALRYQIDLKKENTRSDAGSEKDPMIEHTRLLDLAKTAKEHGDMETHKKLTDKAATLATRSDADPSSAYAAIQRKLARGQDITAAEQEIVDKMIGNSPSRNDNGTASNSTRAGLRAAHVNASNEARGASVRVFKLKKDGTRSGTPVVNNLFTEEEAQRKIAYWESVNPGSKFVMA